MKLTNNRCKCAHCGEYFNSLRAFDRHRKGTFLGGGKRRYCLTVFELMERGWSKSDDGFWVTETFAQRRARAAASGGKHRLLN